MRILHCIPTMLGGGAERQLCYLSEGLVRLGHCVHVVIMQDGPNTDRLRAAGGEVHHLGRRNPYDVTTFVDLCRIIRQTGSDVVQTWLARMDMWGGLAAQFLRRPWVYSERSVWRGSQTWRDALRRRIIERASAVVANSEAGATYWRGLLAGRTPIHVVANALPLDDIGAARPARRADLGIPDDAEVILYAGRFHPEAKNIALLTEILCRVLRERPNAWALCCGEGPLLASFRAHMTQVGLAPRVVTPGYRTDIWSVMKASNLFLSTSEWEGRPNAVLEAMACACPLALSDIPQHREFVPDDGGVFFPPQSSPAAVAVIHAALDGQDATRRGVHRSLGIARTFSVDAMAETYAAIYDQLLDGR